MLLSPLALILSFLLLWLGSGMALFSLEKLSHRLRSSSFAISFLLLGIFTSLSEFSVGVNAVIDKKPEIFVGDLLGASLVLILLIIPLMAIIHNGIKISVEESDSNFIAALIVISLPIFLLLDREISFIDASIMITSFVLLAFLVQKRRNIIMSIKDGLVHNTKVGEDVVKIVVGAVLVFGSCKVLVDNLIHYSNIYGVSTFLVSLLLLSIGTNIPELTILVRSYFDRSRSVALGDYIGSASFNTFLMGMLTFLTENKVMLNGGIRYNLFLLPIGCIVFYFISRKKKLSRKGGIFLLILYGIFLLTELI